jgi:hypothetical protein
MAVSPGVLIHVREAIEKPTGLCSAAVFLLFQAVNSYHLL